MGLVAPHLISKVHRIILAPGGELTSKGFLIPQSLPPFLSS